MKVYDILKLTESGTVVTIWDGINNGFLVRPTYLNNHTIANEFKPYMDSEVISINTSNADDDIELVVR